MKSKIWNNLLIIWLLLIFFSATSCIPHIHGNGKVVKEERNVSNFSEISVGNGIDVRITQDTFEKVIAETDENIQKILKTEVHGTKLKIYLEEGVQHARELRVHVTLKQLNLLDASSGADVKSMNKITSDNLTIHSSSGSDVNMEVSCQSLKVDSSSGSDLSVSGTSEQIEAESSSGSDLDASKLVAKNCVARASSGSDLDVHATMDVKAHSSSGSDISIFGNPATRDTHSSSGGDINYR
jgi:phosphotransferase system IIA component